MRERAARSGERFVPFDALQDYDTYVDGKPRYEGVRSFLASREISIPDGAEDTYRVIMLAGQKCWAQVDSNAATDLDLFIYDSRGKKLCAAYTGQGESPNANGVDWWE